MAATGDSTDYSGSISTERAEELADVDVIITYGGQELIDALEGDPVLSQLPAVVDPREVVQVVGMGLGLSLLATVYPSWRAARLDPVEALRNE